MAHIYNSGMQFLNGVYCYMDKIQIGLILIHDHVVNIVDIKFHLKFYLPIFFSNFHSLILKQIEGPCYVNLELYPFNEEECELVSILHNWKQNSYAKNVIQILESYAYNAAHVR